jgi:hypothetical protein
VNTSKKNNIPRWGLIALGAALVILLLGSALYAQGFGRRQGNRQGPGMGRGMGMGMGPGMRGPGMAGLMGLGMMMGDNEIRELSAKIRTIQAINHLDLTAGQVEDLRDIALEAQEEMKGEFEPVRDRIVDALQDQLDNVLAGEEIDPDEMRAIMDEARESHEPGELREEMEGYLDRAIDVLTEDQLQMLTEEAGPGRGRFRNWCDGEGPGFFGQGQDGERPGPGFFGRGGGPDGMGERGFGGWFNDLSDEEQDQLRETFRGRIDNMREGAARMKIMMFLISPNSVEAMDLWLDAQ